MKRDTMMR